MTAPGARGAQNALQNQAGDVAFVVMPLALTALATTLSYGAAFGATAGVVAASAAGFVVLTQPEPPAWALSNPLVTARARRPRTRTRLWT